MGFEYNHLEEECESRNDIQKEEICMGWDNNFLDSQGGHEKQIESKKESLELVHPGRVNSRLCWSVIGVNWRWKNEETGC
jgi:hypothetical protein